ncbi:MAG: hypothetical protein R3C97_13730 [Geminicoccaceae bacterium]
MTANLTVSVDFQMERFMSAADAVLERDQPFSNISVAALVPALLAGSAATVAFDLFGQALSPLAGFAKLAPVGLADATIKALFGASLPGAGYLLHMLVGLISYPLGWLLVARPLAARLAPSMPEWLVAAAYGIGLWIFALFGMAHLLVGMPAFLGFTGITWVALAGHVIYALAFVASLKWLIRN